MEKWEKILCSAKCKMFHCTARFKKLQYNCDTSVSILILKKSRTFSQTKSKTHTLKTSIEWHSNHSPWKSPINYIVRSKTELIMHKNCMETSSCLYSTVQKMRQLKFVYQLWFCSKCTFGTSTKLLTRWGSKTPKRVLICYGMKYTKSSFIFRYQCRTSRPSIKGLAVKASLSIAL